ncbi:glycoside hydrolase family 3 N-terminal domain-containing protein [Pedobacter rhodius]|uniref:Glycoside hydrolase family 3 C-terminal domain-containing protein n=1 Tax=Pedobacter rhodius TaxID=3004098 RepID=A0ABT4KZ66_9SPHI|nr:glycoside hydrolase family 3 N-terminal domain-containing protein [Pedobacter sp. SJ11]MCZ4223138.1 glycoside hydrolase family 3 C-terminal domain-containing protein [Pedobacter sp. SJ11]
MKKNIKTIFCLVSVISIFNTKVFAQSKTNIPLYKNSKMPVESRIKDLLSRMTVEEKVGQISMPLGWPMYSKSGDNVEVSETFKKSLREEYTGMLWATLRADPWTKKTLVTGLNPELAAKATNAIQKYAVENTRLGIPILLSEECPHGHMAIGTTVFPTSIGQGSTFNPELIKKMATVIAEETRLQGGHVGYGPVLDLAREPRWSRVEETYGEDHVLNSRMGEAMVQGFQGNNLKSGVNVVATLKHFAAYGAPEGGHNGGSINVGLRSLNQFYLPPFKASVKAGALSVMTAYNSIDGIPCSSNEFLLNDLLRKEWNFKGFVVSDLNSISGLKANHHIADNAAEAAALSINAGLDADLSGIGYGKALRDAIKAGKVSIKTLDTAVSRVLRIKFNMGLFENPYVNPETAKLKVRDTQKIALARQVARESIILLKNQHQTLPLSKTLKNIAVIGPNADNIYNQIGDYTAPQQEENIVTVLKGIKNKLSAETKINYVKGCGIRDTSSGNIDEAVSIAKKSDAVVIVLGGSSARDFKTEYIETGAAKIKTADKALSDMESGEGYDRSTLDLLGDQLKLLKAVVKTGKPVVLVLIKGRPLNLNWASENVPAIIDAWYPGQEGGNAIADVIFGDYNPAGRLPISVPKSVGQLPVYYNARFPEKHDYLEIDAKPLYSFGYGLSYTTFDYQNLKIEYKADKPIVNVSFDLKNSGSFDGEEVVQLYLKSKTSSVVLPSKQLKQFRRIFLKAGEQKTLNFILNKDDLEIYNNKMKWVVEPGTYQLMVSSSSDNIRLEGQFVINKNSFSVEN